METNNPDSGCYQLLIEFRKKRKIKIGALGEIMFPTGYYVYTGRAKKGLRKRVERHCRTHKKRHWHIDYLLEKSNIIKVFYYPGRLDECRIHKEGLDSMKDSQVVKYFGSSDCGCEGHLFRTERKPSL